MTTPDNRPVSELFADAISQFSSLVRDEIHLARAELTVKAKQAIAGAGLLAGAAILLIPTVVLLMMGLASFLVELGTSPSIAHFAAGGGGLVVVIILWWAGTSRLKANKLVPDRTLGQLHRDAAAAREHV